MTDFDDIFLCGQPVGQGRHFGNHSKPRIRNLDVAPVDPYIATTKRRSPLPARSQKNKTRCGIIADKREIQAQKNQHGRNVQLKFRAKPVLSPAHDRSLFPTDTHLTEVYALPNTFQSITALHTLLSRLLLFIQNCCSGQWHDLLPCGSHDISRVRK